MRAQKTRQHCADADIDLGPCYANDLKIYPTSHKNYMWSNCVFILLWPDRRWSLQSRTSIARTPMARLPWLILT